VSTPGGNIDSPHETFEAAVRWSERLRDEHISEREMLAWLSWYECADANSRVFDELQEFWRTSQRLALTPRGREFIEQMQAHSLWDRWRWRAENWLTSSLKGLSTSTDSVTSWRSLALGFRALAVVLIAALVLSPYRDSGPGRFSGGFVREMTLADNSRVELAPHTTVAVAYAPGERRLEMSSGEANFVVAPNKSQPFIVHAGGLFVRAVGTQFSIHQVGAHIAVTVTEGKVDVYDDSQPDLSGTAAAVANGPRAIVRVTAGHQFKSAGYTDQGTLVPIDVRETLTWREGRLRYVNEPLSVVIADINRYVARPIVIKDQRLKSLTYTGTVFTQLIDEWLNTIPKEFPLVVVTESDQTVLISRTADYHGTL
jgi:transmembrane sensor